MRFAAGLVILVACSSGDDGPPGGGDGREQVLLTPVVVNRDLDLLFVIDDSPSTLHMQTSIKNAFNLFVSTVVQQLTPLQRGFLNLHVGVVTSDLGTFAAADAQPGPAIGSGPGSCSGMGKNGNLQTNGTMLVTGPFISDIENTDGTRTLNYTGTLVNALAAIVSVGSSGCGFEQPLEAMLRALDNNPANAGFLRPDAALAIVLVQDEDDCSLAHSSLLWGDATTLGPLQSFRCTRFGVKCDDGGADDAAMNTLGMKSKCHWDEASAYLTTRDRYDSFLATIKADRRNVLFTAIAAGADSLAVEERTPPGGGSAIPALAHACSWNATDGTHVADPAVRVQELADHVARGHVENPCMEDLSGPMINLGFRALEMLGDPCLMADIAMPADCIVADQTLSGETPVPACSASRTTDCYQLVEDVRCATRSHLRVDVTRTSPASADTMVSVRCRI